MEFLRSWLAARRIADARYRIEASKQAKEQCVEMLEEFNERVLALIDCGRLGLRGDDKPVLRLVYWGDIEAGTLAAMCIEADYGGSFRARIPVWARFAGLFQNCGASLWALAWAWLRRSSMVGRKEAIWGHISETLSQSCSSLVGELDFPGSKAQALGFDPSVEKGVAGLAAEQLDFGGWLNQSNSGASAQWRQPEEEEAKEISLAAIKICEEAKKSVYGQSKPHGAKEEGGGEHSSPSGA